VLVPLLGGGTNQVDVLGYARRYDLNADGLVNVVDRSIVVFYVGCTAGAFCTP
jgi:hypothetical protein